jgi:hypothetical protein
MLSISETAAALSRSKLLGINLKITGKDAETILIEPKLLPGYRHVTCPGPAMKEAIL